MSGPAGVSGVFRRTATPFAAIMLAALISSCSYGNRVRDDTISGPLGAISLAHVDPGTVAVLAGDPKEKTVSVFHDSQYGAEVVRFPVSRFASAVRAAGPNQVVLAIAPPRGWGALEFWSLNGQHLRTFRMPMPILNLSSTIDDTVYALGDSTHGRVAIPIALRTGALYPSFRVADGTDSLDVCIFGRRPFLMTGSNSTDSVELIDTVSGRRLHSGIAGEHPLCLPHAPAILTIEHSPFSRTVQIVRLSRYGERLWSIVAPPDAIDITSARDGTLFILRVTGADSEIEIWRPQDMAER